ncbi:MAG TPA: serine protease, partial [Allocoleopsis sp.]
MKKLISLALIASISNLLFISSGTAQISTPKHINTPSIITAQIPNNIQNIAQNITVKVHVKDSRGSGILIAKKGQVYTVLTNAHVVNRDKPFRIQTPDGKFYNANLIKKGDSLNGDDLAILQFKSNVNYQVAILGDSTKLSPNQDVYTAGFPYEKEQLKLNSGKISLIAENPLKGGYQIGFTNDTEQGMSGGSILNSDGKLIGVIGMGAYAILDDAYTYQNGKKPDQDTLKKLRELRFAVPIATITKIDGQLISLLPKEPPKIQQKNYTGIVGDIDKIAEKITVRIDVKN